MLCQIRKRKKDFTALKTIHKPPTTATLIKKPKKQVILLKLWKCAVIFIQLPGYKST